MRDEESNHWLSPTLVRSSGLMKNQVLQTVGLIYGVILKIFAIPHSEALHTFEQTTEGFIKVKISIIKHNFLRIVSLKKHK